MTERAGLPIQQRASRAIRPVGERTHRLTSRDIAILRALAKMRILPTREIARLFFGSRSAANGRLRKLFEAGWIQCFVRDLAADNLYGLTAKSARWLAVHDDIPIETISVYTGLGRLHLDHLLALNALRISLARALAKHPRFELRGFLPEWELKARAGTLPMLLIPDALVEIGQKETPGARGHRVAVEIDRGHENASWFGREKLRKYRGIEDGHGFAWMGTWIDGVVTVVPTVRRVRELVRAAAKEECGERFLFAASPTEEEIVGPHFQSPSGTHSLQLLDHLVTLRARGAGAPGLGRGA